MMTRECDHKRVDTIMATPKSNYRDLVHQVVHDSPEPLPFEEIMQRVNKIQRITTRNPTGTIRNGISQSRLIVNTGDRRYGWKYRVINGSVLRIPLSKHDLQTRQIAYPEEVRDALFPAFFESQKRNDSNPVRLALPNGVITEWTLDHFVKSEWGTRGTPAFWEWFDALHAKPGDALVLRVHDGEARHYAVEFEPQAARNEEAIAQRNQEMIQAALAHFRRTPNGAELWDTSSHLLATGRYIHPIPPDSLEEIWTEDIWGPELAMKPVRSEWLHETDLKMEPLIESLYWQITPPQKARRVKTPRRSVSKRPTGASSEPVTFHIKPKSLYQLKVTLIDAHPPIWRQIQVPGEIHLSELHGVLQIAMGWTNSHLHQFRIGERDYGIPDEDSADYLPDLMDERQVRLEEVAQAKTRFVYEYDFGDSWRHQIFVEAIVKPTHAVEYPVCLAGERACPPEDVGGVWGYAKFLQALRDPKHPEHDEFLTWVGGTFDPNQFDLNFVNRTVRRFVHRLVTWSQE
jgi:pRiA4b ORF-3-like protein